MSAAAAKKLRGVASGYISRTLLAQSVTFSFGCGGKAVPLGQGLVRIINLCPGTRSCS